MFRILQLLSHHFIASPGVRPQSLLLQTLRASSAWRTVIPSLWIPPLCTSFTKNLVISSGKTKGNTFPSHEKMSSNVTWGGCTEPLGNIPYSGKKQHPGRTSPTTQAGILQHLLKTELESKEQGDKAKMRDGRKHQIWSQHQNLTKWKSPDRKTKFQKERRMNQKSFRIKFSTQKRIKLVEEQNKRQKGTQVMLKKVWKKKCSHQRNIKKKKSFFT